MGGLLQFALKVFLAGGPGVGVNIASSVPVNEQSGSASRGNQLTKIKFINDLLSGSLPQPS